MFTKNTLVRRPNGNIGFFDSGLGGLFILKHVVEAMPRYHYVYLGDTENVPYGSKSDEEIYALTKKSLEHLFHRHCQLVIFACNTASVMALRRIQDEFLPRHFPQHKVLGVIIPTVEEILVRPSKTVALIATERTIRSGKYERELAKLGSAARIVTLATPALVPLIEGNQMAEAEAQAVRLVREKLMSCHPDTLVLGCTHYGLLKRALRQAFPSLRILTQEEIIPDKLRDYLARHLEIETGLTRTGGQEIFLSRVTPRYREQVYDWFKDAPLSAIGNIA